MPSAQITGIIFIIRENRFNTLISIDSSYLQIIEPALNPRRKSTADIRFFPDN